MANKEYYKILQISEHLIAKYGYTQVLISKFEDTVSNENWYYKENDPNYQLIRVSLYRASTFSYDMSRVDTYIQYFKEKSKNGDISFLDIHISDEEYNSENEPYDYLNIEHNFHNGVDIHSIYPEIYTAIHSVQDGEKETLSIAQRIEQHLKSKFKNLPFYKKHRYFCTYTIMAICIINFLVGLFLKFKFNDSSAIYIVLGADYKTFTYGLNEFYRLITYAFVHNDLLHITCNLISLLVLGKYAENRFGHTKYMLILFFSILCGSLTQEILSDNVVCMGISAGIYGLMVIYIIESIKDRRFSLLAALPTILINISLNFLSTTAWMAHLGGAIGGFVIYFYLQDYKNLFRLGLLILFLLCLIYKYATIDTINNIYAGTDFEVINIFDSLGLSKLAQNLFNKLMELYMKLGG